MPRTASSIAWESKVLYIYIFLHMFCRPNFYYCFISIGNITWSLKSNILTRSLLKFFLCGNFLEQHSVYGHKRQAHMTYVYTFRITNLSPFVLSGRKCSQSRFYKQVPSKIYYCAKYRHILEQ